MIIRANGSTSNSEYFYFANTDGTPGTGITVTDIDIYYVEQGAAISSKADCTALASATAAYTSGGAFEIGQGIYRIDFPNAAYDGGAGKVVMLTALATGYLSTPLRVQLSPSVIVEDDSLTAAKFADECFSKDNYPSGYFLI